MSESPDDRNDEEQNPWLMYSSPREIEVSERLARLEAHTEHQSEALTEIQASLDEVAKQDDIQQLKQRQEELWENSVTRKNLVKYLGWFTAFIGASASGLAYFGGLV
jgi:hypothetical protein